MSMGDYGTLIHTVKAGTHKTPRRKTGDKKGGWRGRSTVPRFVPPARLLARRGIVFLGTSRAGPNYCSNSLLAAKPICRRPGHHASTHSERNANAGNITQKWLRRRMKSTPKRSPTRRNLVGTDDGHLVAVVLGKAGWGIPTKANGSRMRPTYTIFALAFARARILRGTRGARVVRAAARSPGGTPDGSAEGRGLGGGAGG